MTRLLSKKQICMGVGYMLDRLWYWLLVKWEYLKFYCMNPEQYLTMYKLKYFSWLFKKNKGK